MKNIRANIVGASYEPDGELTEKVMTKKDIKKRDEIADAISTKDMKDRYGDKNVKYAIATKIVMDKKKKKKKEEMKEELDEKDKPFVKKLVKNLKKGSKTHEKQAKKLEKAMKENTAIESELVIQDWNSDDIKFTEIETVDIIKAKPLKEAKKKIIVKGLKALGNLSKKTKIKSISPKPVATPGTTFATGGKFPPGSFSNVSDYAGAVPKATKTGGQMYSTTYDLGTRLSPGAIKPVKGAFKGGGSLREE